MNTRFLMCFLLGPVLIVPGTGAEPEKAYGSNFGKLLPANGFPVCYLDTPLLSLGDAQITYVPDLPY
jgi:hypothetical protein